MERDLLEESVRGGSFGTIVEQGLEEKLVVEGDARGDVDAEFQALNAVGASVLESTKPAKNRARFEIRRTEHDGSSISL